MLKRLSALKEARYSVLRQQYRYLETPEDYVKPHGCITSLRLLLEMIVIQGYLG